MAIGIKKLLILSLLLLSVFTAAEAKYTKTCKVKYKTQGRWSEYYTVDVNFLSGSELNSATSSYNYQTYSTYAVIFWGNGKAAVIQISGYTGCGTEVTESCIINKIYNLEGEDQIGRDWEICTRTFCI